LKFDSAIVFYNMSMVLASILRPF